MVFMRRNWYRVGIVIFIALSFFMIFIGHRILSEIQVILLASFMALLIHQFEEYILPGGAPVVLNRVLYGEKQDYDRFPGNAQSCLIVNVSAWVFYLLPVFFPQILWLGLAQMFFGFFQFFGHGLQMNIKGKSLYNPGLFSVLFLHIPIGVYYICFIESHYVLGWTVYAYGFVGFVAAFVCTTVIPVQILKNSATPYVMDGLKDSVIARRLDGKGV